MLRLSVTASQVIGRQSLSFSPYLTLIKFHGRISSSSFKVTSLFVEKRSFETVVIVVNKTGPNAYRMDEKNILHIDKDLQKK